MRTITGFLAAALLLASPFTVAAAQLSVEITPATANPSHPRMGDRLAFRSIIRNTGPDKAANIVAWLSLLRVDPGKEQPVDLEDWSAQKAVTLPSLAPGETVETEWPVRLIQAGAYRVAVIAATAGGAEPGAPVASPFAGFTVAAKPVIESGRVLPVAIGVPLVLGAALLWRTRGRRTRPT
jgi:hypothetical protein